MWRFPFGALPVGGVPLSALVPTVLTIPGASNLPKSHGRRWVGHFDLALPYAIADLQTVAAGARSRSTSLTLIDKADELALMDDASFVFIACHGFGLRAEQRIRMADGGLADASHFSEIPPGLNVILNTCWLGLVEDEPGTEPIDLPLLLLANGAHSVMATLGPVSDYYTSEFVGSLVEQLGDDLTVAAAAHRTIKRALSADADLPLVRWAPYITIGRSTYYG
jgi:CHAT domain-containing protein